MEPRAEPKGAEGRTLIERFAGLLRLPYVWASLLLSLILTGPGTLLASFLDTRSLEKARTALLSPQANLPLWQIVTGNVLFTALSFYAFLIVRYMRMRVVAAEKQLVPLLPNGKGDYLRAFGRLSLWYAPAPLAVLFFFLFLRPLLETYRATTGLVHLGQLAASTIVNEYLYATMILVYFRSIYGMHRIGRLPLSTKPYYVDHMLGLRPAGVLSLSLASAYFGGMILLTGIHLFNLTYARVQFSVALIVMIVFGVLMFFLPLTSFHKHMVRVKLREKALARAQFARIAGSKTSANTGTSEKETLKDIRRVLIDLKQILLSTAIESQVNAIPAWPFDLNIIGRLVTILLAVTAGVMVRIITARFGL